MTQLPRCIGHVKPTLLGALRRSARNVQPLTPKFGLVNLSSVV
jgi:hypothetical protein